MKKTSTPAQATWGTHLAAFDTYLKTRGMAEKTRKAYGTDAAQLAEWAAPQELTPFDLTPRLLRRYAGVISERGLSKSSVARKIASIRAFYRHLMQRGLLEANPADLVATPKKDQYLPRVLKPAEAAEVLDSIGADGPLALRDRALFEVAYGSGLRAAAPESHRMPSATRSPRISSRAAPTCARSRSCWATRASARRRHTLG